MGGVLDSNRAVSNLGESAYKEVCYLRRNMPFPLIYVLKIPHKNSGWSGLFKKPTPAVGGSRILFAIHSGVDGRYGEPLHTIRTVHYRY